MKKDSLESFGEVIEKELLKLFIPNSKIVLPFTEDSAKYICSKNNLDYNEVEYEAKIYFRYNSLSKSRKNLACCIFQVVVAYKCINYDTSSFNERYAEYLGIDVTQLQSIYKQETYYEKCPYQEVLWIRTRNYLKEQLNLILNIPPQTTHAGRYVQYPNSQKLFNLRDFKKFYDELHSLLLKSNYITFDECSEKIFGERIICTNKILQEKNSLTFERIARQIVFYCCCNYIEKTIRQNKESLYKDNNIANKYSVKLENDSHLYRFFDGEEEIRHVGSIIEKIQEKTFVYDEVYDDWIRKDTYDIEENIGIFIKQEKRHQFSHMDFISCFNSNTSHTISFYILSEKGKENFVKEKIKKRLVGGIKDEFGRYILGLLPILDFSNYKYSSFSINEKTFPISQNKVQDLNLCIQSSGLHIVRLWDSKPFPMEVRDSSDFYSISRGWKWSFQQANFESVDDGWILSGIDCIGFRNNTILYKRKMDKIKNRFDLIGNRFEQIN